MSEPRIFSLGNRFFQKKPKDAKLRVIRDKLARRMLRARGFRHRGDKKLERCRQDDLEIAKLAENSHERQRAIAADRKERREARRQKQRRA